MFIANLNRIYLPDDWDEYKVTVWGRWGFKVDLNTFSLICVEC